MLWPQSCMMVYEELELVAFEWCASEIVGRAGLKGNRATGDNQDKRVNAE